MILKKKNYVCEYFDIIKISIYVWCEMCIGECFFVYFIYKIICFCMYYVFSLNWFGNMIFVLIYICIIGIYICIGLIYKLIGKKVW